MNKRILGLIVLMILAARIAGQVCTCGGTCSNPDDSCMPDPISNSEVCICYAFRDSFGKFGMTTRNRNTCVQAGNSCKESSRSACCKGHSCAAGVCVKDTYLGIALSVASLASQLIQNTGLRTKGVCSSKFAHCVKSSDCCDGLACASTSLFKACLPVSSP